MLRLIISLVAMAVIVFTAIQVSLYLAMDIALLSIWCRSVPKRRNCRATRVL